PPRPWPQAECPVRDPERAPFRAAAVAVSNRFSRPAGPSLRAETGWDRNPGRDTSGRLSCPDPLLKPVVRYAILLRNRQCVRQSVGRPSFQLEGANCGICWIDRADHADHFFIERGQFIEERDT